MQASEGIAKQFSTSLALNKIWGDIIVNVKAYGAKGNGNADDTAAIQAAIDYAVSIGKHDIYFPPGTYNYDVLTNAGDITAYGDGVALNGETVLNVVSYDSIAAQLADIASIVALGGLKDGTADISTIVQNYAAGKDEIYIYLPQGHYRWDNTITLDNKKIKFRGDNAIIEHYQAGFMLKVGNVTTHNTQEFTWEGIHLINKRPKPATNGTGASGVRVLDCKYVFINDYISYDAEQYGLTLRDSGGIIEHCVIANSKVLRCSGTLATTTSIALETQASSGDGYIGNLQISNSYFEVTDTYTDSGGGTTTVTLNNACKLQACNNIEISNVDFMNGKENGPLSFIYDVKKVKMSNVNCLTTSTSSKGLTLSSSPNLELYATNCELGVDGFTQSIGTNDSFKKVKLTNCKLQRITTITGSPENFELIGCLFYLPTSSLNITVSNSIFKNCSIDRSSPIKSMIVSGSGNEFTNFSGIQTFEISGNNNNVYGGDCESLRPNGTSSNCKIKGLRMTADTTRSFRCLTSTVSGWLLENCTFERLQGGGDTSIVNIQGTGHVFVGNTIVQKDKTVGVNSAVLVASSTDCKFIEKRNFFDVNYTTKINVGTSTGFIQYETGDTFVNAGTPQIWNGSAFVAT